MKILHGNAPLLISNYPKGVMQKLLQNDRRLRPLLLDFEKAYDRVSHKWLERVIVEAKLPTQFRNIIM